MGSDKRPIIKLRSTAGTGYTYVTTKNKTNTCLLYTSDAADE